MTIYKNTILITEEYFKENSPIPQNYNWEEIVPFISIAQRIWIRPILGDKLYQELLKEVRTNTITPENSTLLLKMYPFLSMCSVYESLPFVVYSFTEKGIVQQKSETSEPIDSQAFTELKNDIRAKLEVLKEEFKDFLKSHSDCFPDLISQKPQGKPNNDLRVYGSNNF